MAEFVFPVDVIERRYNHITDAPKAIVPRSVTQTPQGYVVVFDHIYKDGSGGLIQDTRMAFVHYPEKGKPTLLADVFAQVKTGRS